MVQNHHVKDVMLQWRSCVFTDNIWPPVQHHIIIVTIYFENVNFLPHTRVGQLPRGKRPTFGDTLLRGYCYYFFSQKHGSRFVMKPGRMSKPPQILVLNFLLIIPQYYNVCLWHHNTWTNLFSFQFLFKIFQEELEMWDSLLQKILKLKLIFKFKASCRFV